MLSLQCNATDRQRGVILVLVLIVLVALTLAAVALNRSTVTANGIAGNLGFKQSATSSADQGLEAAVAWLENNTGQASSASASSCAIGSTVLACDQAARGYLATRQDPGFAQDWPDLWAALVSAGAQPGQPNGGAADAAGNTVAYLIQRMCSSTGDPANGTCSSLPDAVGCGSGMGLGSNGGGGNLNCKSQVYYRITVQVSGPRNTAAWVQAMVAL